jgi:NTP pyrophosphatase (non-canonical NTP hydrolase)
MKINELVQLAHENAKNKGFWEDYNFIESLVQVAVKTNEVEDAINASSMVNNAVGNRLMLIVSEIAEAQEALRKGDEENFKEELADVAIRLADLCGGLNINLEEEIVKKMERNKQRPYKHGKAF